MTIPAPSVDFIFLPVAEKMGFFAQEGLDVQVSLTTPQAGIQAMVAGQYQFGGAVGSAQSAAAKGLPVRVVAAYQTRPSYRIFARMPATSLRDLVGKKIAISALGGAADILLRSALVAEGVDPTTVTIIPLQGGTTAEAALKSGTVDAAQIGNSGLAAAQRNKDWTELNVYSNVQLISVGVVTSLKVIDEQPDVIRSMLRATTRAVDYMNNNKDGTVKIMQEYLKMSTADAADTYDASIGAGDFDLTTGKASDELITNSLKIVQESLKLPNAIPGNQVFDFSFVAS